MKRLTRIFLVLAAVVVLIAVPIYRSSAEGPLPVAGNVGQKWQYAQLITGDFLNGGLFSFTAPDSYVEDRTSQGLFRKLGGTEKIIKHLPALSEMQMDLFNQIGSKGWELVTVAPEGAWGVSKGKEAENADGGGLTRVYLFKRPAAK